MCGDHDLKKTIKVADEGSPPHVRGPLIFFIFFTSIFGITPACAGTTSYGNLSMSYNRDHPRMCGDHDEATVYPREIAGSPPHVRGPL